MLNFELTTINVKLGDCDHNNLIFPFRNLIAFRFPH